MIEEMWDAYDENESRLGFEVPRSMAKSLPEGVFHVAVFVYSVTKSGSVLTTQRSSEKTYPLKWEVTGGSILTGETPREGAVRELYEETGIECSTEQLIPLYDFTAHKKHCIYHAYALEINDDVAITLQDGETVDYKLIPYDEFKDLVMSDAFVPSEKRRFIQYADVIDSKLRSIMNI